MKKKSDLDSPQESKLPFKQVKDAYRNVFETPSPLLPVKNLLNQYNLNARKGSTVKRMNEIQQNPSKFKLYEQSHEVESSESDDEEKIELEEHEKERIERERLEDLVRNLQKWLCFDDENIFLGSEIEQNMKNNEGLVFLMDFVVDPLKHLIDSQVFFYLEF